MKNKSNFLLLSSLVGGLLFSFLFWEERLALNLLIYSIYLITITYLNADVPKSKKLIIFSLAHLFAAILIIINNSDLTLASYYISLILFIGFAHNQQIRTVFTAFIATFLQMVTVPFNTIRNLGEVTIGNFNLKPIFKIFRYAFIPAVIVVIFTCLYSAASSVFAHYAEMVLVSIGDFFNNIFGFIFKDLTFGRFMHFVFGLTVTASLLLAFFNKSLQQFELGFKEQLLRIRRNSNQKTIWFEVMKVFSGNILTKKLALKTEYFTAVISFVALNILLLLLNGLDIWWLWLGMEKKISETNYSAGLHDGTNALIFSIVLAMTIIIYFFRGNLNFYSKSKTLRVLAFAWMIQNVILIISVLIRDQYYIEFYGLTHKRIGVLVFALLCIIGLATVYLKVARQKTLFYLLKVNGCIWFALLLAFSTINWDVFIVKYNLSHRDKISLDVDYLLSLSDKTLPVLDKNRLKLHVKNNIAGEPQPVTSHNIDEHKQNELNQRIAYFKERYERVSWLSWNLQDWKTAEYFRFVKK